MDLPPTVYAAGVRDLGKITRLDHALETVPGLRDKVGSNHNIVCRELDEPPSVTTGSIREVFSRFGLRARFVGVVAAEMRPKSQDPAAAGLKKDEG